MATCPAGTRWCTEHEAHEIDECIGEVGSFVMEADVSYRKQAKRIDEDHPVAVQIRKYGDTELRIEVQLSDETSGLQDTTWITPTEADRLGRLLVEAALRARPCPFYWCGGCEWEADVVGGALSRHHNRYWPSGVNCGVVEFPDRWDEPQVTIPEPPNRNMDEVTDLDWLFAISVDLVLATAAVRGAAELIELRS